MKNLPILLIFFAHSVFAQNLHIAWQRGFQHDLQDLKATADGSWLVGGSYGVPGMTFRAGYMGRFDSDGVIERELSLNILEQATVTALLPLADGRWIAGGIINGCDFGGSGFVALYDTTWEYQWFTSLDWVTLTNPVVFVSSLHLFSDSTVLAIGSGKAQLFSMKNGDILEELTLPGYYHGGAAAPNSAYLMVSGTEGLIALFPDLTLKTIVPLGSAFSTYFYEITAGQDDRFFAVREDNTLVAADTTGILTSLKLNYHVTDIASDGPNIWLCGRQNNFYRIEKRDKNLNLLTGFNLTDPDILPIRVQPDGPNVLLAGWELHGPPPRQNTLSSTSSWNFWLASFTPIGQLIHPGTDAALTEIVANTPPVKSPVTGAPGYSWSVSGGTFSVRIQNLGTEVLNSVQVLASGYGKGLPFICIYDAFVNRPFTDLNLAPGADTLLYLGEIAAPYVSGADALSWELCFWTAVPNNKMDSNHENDYHCQVFEPTTSTFGPNSPELRIFPNPVQDLLYLELPNERPGPCQIFDAAGRLVLTAHAENRDSGFAVVVDQLPAGIYFLQMQQAWGRFVKK